MNLMKHSLLGGLLMAGLAAAACNRAQARVIPELPALDVPAPPPRIVEVIEPEPPPPAPEPLPAAPTPLKPKPVPTQQRAEPTRTEPAKAEVPPPTEAPRPADAGKPPVGTLQTAPAGQEAQLEKTIVEMIARAGASLNRIDYGTLNGDARTQYDQAKRFISQAQDALRTKNLAFAANLADKANTLASQLSGR
jgi:hypothetical protein